MPYIFFYQRHDLDLTSHNASIVGKRMEQGMREVGVWGAGSGKDRGQGREREKEVIWERFLG